MIVYDLSDTNEALQSTYFTSRGEVGAILIGFLHILFYADCPVWINYMSYVHLCKQFCHMKITFKLFA